MLRSVARPVDRTSVALAVLALGQVISPVVFAATGNDLAAGESAQLPITPAGYAFAIWTLIQLLSLGYAAWAALTTEDGADLRRRLAAPLAVVFAGFTLWLVAAAVQPAWWTLAIFLGMLAALVRALSVALAHRAEIAAWNPLGRTLLWGLLGAYTGWTSIAVWVNLGASAVDSGAPVAGTAALVGQLAVLSGATATGAALAWWTRGLLPYAAAAAWGLVGAAIGAQQAGAPVPAAAALGGLVVVVGVTAARWVGARRRVRPGAGLLEPA
jgi:hypothetical protein